MALTPSKLPNLLIKLKYFTVMTSTLDSINAIPTLPLHLVSGLNQIEFKTFKSFLIPGVMQLKNISVAVMKLTRKVVWRLCQ